MVSNKEIIYEKVVDADYGILVAFFLVVLLSIPMSMTMITKFEKCSFSNSMDIFFSGIFVMFMLVISFKMLKMFFDSRKVYWRQMK